MRVDASTLTRNLQPLIAQGWVARPGRRRTQPAGGERPTPVAPNALRGSAHGNRRSWRSMHGSVRSAWRRCTRCSMSACNGSTVRSPMLHATIERALRDANTARFIDCGARAASRGTSGGAGTGARQHPRRFHPPRQCPHVDGVRVGHRSRRSGGRKELGNSAYRRVRRDHANGAVSSPPTSQLLDRLRVHRRRRPAAWPGAGLRSSAEWR